MSQSPTQRARTMKAIIMIAICLILAVAWIILTPEFAGLFMRLVAHIMRWLQFH